MNFHQATLSELYTVTGHDKEARLSDKLSAAKEIVKRLHTQRKPYRNNQMKVRKAVSRW